jgi:hypothetical protein
MTIEKKLDLKLEEKINQFYGHFNNLCHRQKAIIVTT